MPTTIVWPAPAPVMYPSPLSSAQLDAVAYAGPAVPVSLASSYNITGITTNGYVFSGGFDGSSWAWSAELLGTSVTWQGINFPIGPADAPDAVYGATIPLPSGNFGSVLVLGDVVNNQTPPTAQFVIQYTDGSTTTIVQNMSDWVNPRSYPGESEAKCVPSRQNANGTIDANSVCVYGYQFAVDPTRILQSITLPNDRNVVVLSMMAVPSVVSGTYSYSPAAGMIPTPGNQPLYVSFTPSSAGYSAATASTVVPVSPASPQITPTIDWPTPAPVPAGTALGAAQLDASTYANVGPVIIPLAPYDRVNAVYADGTVFEEKGVDGSGAAYSSNQLGTALHYAGLTFPLGPLAVPDAVTSTTINLPSGSYSTLYLLGTGANGAQLAQSFTVTYTDGTTTSAQLNLSSWESPQYFSDETIVASTSVANTEDGGQVAGTYDVYGYQIALDPTRSVASLTLPTNTNVIILAAGLGSQASFAVPGNFVYTPPAGTIPTTSLTLNAAFTPIDTTDFTSASGNTQLTVGLLDFTLQPINGTVMTATMGDAPTLAFTIAPTQDRYAAPISFAVVGALPPLATVSFSPSTVGVDGGPTTINLTITTRKLSGRLAPWGSMGASSVLVCAIVFIPLGLWKRRSRVARFMCLGSLLVLFGAAASGCGSGYADHIYPLQIQATDGVTTHSLAIELHIEASPQ